MGGSGFDTTTTIRDLLLPRRFGVLQRFFEIVLIPALWAASFIALVVVAVWL
jgi:hypothetical protein